MAGECTGYADDNLDSFPAAAVLQQLLGSNAHAVLFLDKCEPISDDGLLVLRLWNVFPGNRDDWPETVFLFSLFFPVWTMYNFPKL